MESMPVSPFEKSSAASLPRPLRGRINAEGFLGSTASVVGGDAAKRKERAKKSVPNTRKEFVDTYKNTHIQA